MDDGLLASPTTRCEHFLLMSGATDPPRSSISFWYLVLARFAKFVKLRVQSFRAGVKYGLKDTRNFTFMQA